MASNGFVSQYKAELRELTFNSKAIINTLTMLAGENKNAATDIAEALEEHIRSCPPASKLPALYLLDSIVKNIGLPYSALFARDIPEVFMAVWLVNPATRQSLQKLLNTWHRYFPSDKLSAISQAMTAPQQEAAPQQHGYQQNQSQYYQRSDGRLTGQPGTSYPSYHDARSSAWAGQAMYQQQQMTNPQASQPQYAQQPYNSTPHNNNYASAYTPTYPQPQYISGQQLSPLPSPQAAQQAGSVQGFPGPPDNGLPAFLSELIGAGLLPAGNAVKAQPAARLAFDSSKFKEMSDVALQLLGAGTEKTRPAFLDQRLHKKRKLAAGAASSRQWFVNKKDWLAGTSADSQANPAFFDEPAQVEDAQTQEEEASMPADPEQPECAISQEKFNAFWDDVSNSWRYQGATALTAEQAEQYGLSEGQLVKVSCLAPPSAHQGNATARDSIEVAKHQEAADEIARTTLAETEKAEDKADEKQRPHTATEEISAAELERSPKRQKVE